MKAFGSKKLKILFGVPEGDYYARQFIAVATAMPEAECRFIGFSWSTGLEIRKAGLHYSHVAWWSKVVDPPRAVPPVAEFTVRGYSQDTAPDSTRKAFAALSKFIESELEKFAPDIVVYGPIDHSICYLMDKSAERRGIARLGIQPSFISNRFIVQSQGDNWMEHLRTAEVPDSFEKKEADNCQSEIGLRRVPDSKSAWNLHLWIRGGECAMRVLIGGTSFDTLQSLSSLFTSRVTPQKWFPNVQTLESIEEVGQSFVLVALHQPALCSWDCPGWVDLISFALEATPEDIPLIIRPHPSESARELPAGLEKMLRSRGVRISRAGLGPDLSIIIRQCLAVMTLNSATGMEALMAGKRVLALAPTYYARPGMAEAVSMADAPAVRKVLEKTEQLPPNADKVKIFVEWMNNLSMIRSPCVSGAGACDLVEQILCKANSAACEKSVA